jgi:alkylation response protein AidB-like acyl-CoA dehydrogenase
MLKSKLISQDINSFADSRLPDFRDEIRGGLIDAIPRAWAEAKEFVDEDERAVKARREWDVNRMMAGFGAMGWPVEYGGNGFNGVEAFAYGEVCEDLQAPPPMNVIGYGLAGTAIITWGNEEQKKRFLPRILSGEDMWCEGFSEPQGGSDMANYQTTATRTDGGWHISGQKIWTSFSPYGDRLYCLTRTSLTAAKRHNMSVFLLDMHAPGIQVRPITQIHGATGFGQVFIDTDIKDADDLLLGNEGEGWNLASIVGAQRAGGRRMGGGAGEGRPEIASWIPRLRECLDEAQASAALRERVSELAIRLNGLRQQRVRIIELAIADRETSRASAVMKIANSELQQALTACGVDIGCPSHETFWRSRHLDYRKMSIAGGPNEIYRNIIANRVLGMGR